jgi:5S rRNA maturation endonuclease (ribonuclease M5)
MLSTKKFVIDIDDVPSYWVFQYYLSLPEKLTGQEIKIRSIFNPTERTPSFTLYVDKRIQQYRFKDFSTGATGSKIDLVQKMFNLNFTQAVNKIIEDYNEYVKDGEIEFITLEPSAKWSIDHVQTREWNSIDAQYWLSYNIGSSMLAEYNVRPVDYFTMVKEQDGKIEQAKFRKHMTYCYFTKDSDPYKLYQPTDPNHKFYNVASHLQGYDQLKYNQPYLVICSSLKDAMCLKSFGYNLEVIAPNSENSMIKPYIIEHLKGKYKNIITLFDNDDAGRQAIQSYVKAYNINGITLTICKDISDAVKEHGIQIIHKHLKPLLKEALNK